MAQLKVALLDGREITVPAVVVAEAWRGGPRAARIARLLASCEVESIDEDLAKKAGEALALLTDGGTVDALVMASASRRGDAVLTADPKDLSQLRACFRNVRIISG
jgi:predicted nucleic acid-binding protein